MVNAVTRRRRASGGATAPIVADQTFDMGALTAAGAGAWTPTNTGTAITSASITSGDASGHWQISSAGVLSPSATGATADMSGGTYTLVCSYNGGADTATHTARCTGTDSNGINRATAYSVATAAEMNTAAGNAVTTSASTPTAILMRPGTYALASTVFNTRAFNSTNRCVVTRHSTDSRSTVIISEPASGNAPLDIRDASNFTIDGLTVKCAGTGSVGRVIFFRDTCSNVTIKNCEISGLSTLAAIDYNGVRPDCPYGVQQGGGATITNVTVQNNWFHDTNFGIELSNGGSTSITGNLFERNWEDFIKIGYNSAKTTVTITDNVMIDPLSDGPSEHPDYIQYLGNNRQYRQSGGAALSRASNVVTAIMDGAAGATGISIGSTITTYTGAGSTFNGTFTVASVSGTTITWNQTAADETVNSSSALQYGLYLAGETDQAVDIQRNIIINSNLFADAPQGLFLSAMTGGLAYTGTIRNNVLVNGTLSSTGIRVQTARGMTVDHNTVIRSVGSSSDTGPTIMIGESYSAGTHTIANNCTEYAITGYGTNNLTNNVALGTNFATYALATAFDGPSFTLLTRADILSQLSLKAAGPLDLATNVGAVGNGYVTWATTSPGNDGSFTAPATASVYYTAGGFDDYYIPESF
jgi:hypothetical protein